MTSKIEATCLICNTKFSYYVGYGFGKYCCRKCYLEAVKIPSKECIICRKVYTPYTSYKPKWDRSKFCSIECANIGKFKGEYVKCSYCGDLVWKNPQRLKNNINNYCSVRCHNNSLKGKSTLKMYKKGYRAEAEVMKELKNEGYMVIRNFLSWGVFDLCAIGLNHVRFIQVKSSSKVPPLSTYKKDIINIIGYVVPEFCTKELWIKSNHKGWKKYIVNDQTLEVFNNNYLENLPKVINKEIVVTERLANIHPKVINDSIILIDSLNKTIEFIQSRPNNLTSEQLDKIKDNLKELNDEFMCSFKVI